MQKGKFLLVGEPMGLFIAKKCGDIASVDDFSLSVAGAELNVSIGLSRLGHDAFYMTKLGCDSIGERIVALMKRNGLTDKFVEYDKLHSTGYMFKGRVENGDPPISYGRRGSAASLISSADIDKLDLTEFRGGFLHLTGITAALSPQMPQTLERLIYEAKKQDMTVSFDPNIRKQLWSSEENMRDTLNHLISLCDLLLPGISEGKQLCGEQNEKDIAKFYLSKGVKAVICKLGAKGAYSASNLGESYSPSYHIAKIVDTVGAGDGFAAGVLSALAEGLSIEQAADRGNAIGSIQLTSLSDNEGLPTREELEKFMRETERETQ